MRTAKSLAPDVSKGPVSLLAVLIDKTPGTRDGKIVFAHPV